MACSILLPEESSGRQKRVLMKMKTLRPFEFPQNFKLNAERHNLESQKWRTLIYNRDKRRISLVNLMDFEH